MRQLHNSDRVYLRDSRDTIATSHDIEAGSDEEISDWRRRCSTSKPPIRAPIFGTGRGSFAQCAKTSAAAIVRARAAHLTRLAPEGGPASTAL